MEKSQHIEKYIDIIISRHNDTTNEETKNLVSREEYKNILRPAINAIKPCGDIELDIVYNSILNNSGIEQSINKFLSTTKLVPGAVIGFGTMNHENTLCFGNRQERPNLLSMEADTIFDLASISKLFTAISIFQLIGKEKISLNTLIGDVDHRFIGIKDVKVETLLGFSQPLRTKARIDEAPDKQEALDLLLAAQKCEKLDNPTKPYTDIGAMVLKHVVEKISQQSFEEYVERNIFNICNMKDSSYGVPEEKCHRAISNNYEKRIIRGKYITFDQTFPGIINDPKARTFPRDAQGHAGVFSTAKDMMNLGKSLIRGEVLPLKFGRLLSSNQTGKKLPGGGCVQYLGYMCHSKSVSRELTEVYWPLSGSALAAAGYTGVEFTVDFDNEIFYFLGTSKCHNRVTNIIPVEGMRIEDYLVTKQGITYAKFEQNEYIYSQPFPQHRAKNLKDPILDLLLQYRFLEDITKKPLLV